MAERARVLVVDDDPTMRDILDRVLTRRGYGVTEAGDAAEARQALALQSFDVLLCDVGLPGESGLELVRDVGPEHPEMATLMVSGIDHATLAQGALLARADGYVIKPFGPNEVIMAVQNAIERRRLARKRTVARSDDPLELLAHELTASREETIRRLSIAVEVRDPEAAMHVTDMSDLCGAIAGELGFTDHHCELIRMASQLHDVGKVAIADSILLKPGALTAEERTEMERHAELGYRILAGSPADVLQLAATIALTHHEKLDGTGYLRGLTGDEIPLEGRIAAVADVFDALTRDRVYRAAMSTNAALDHLEAGRGSHLHPAVLDAFHSILPPRSSGATAVDGS